MLTVAIIAFKPFPHMTYLETERLRLRDWREGDFEPFAEMNAEPRVMEHFSSTLNREQSDAFATRLRQSLLADGRGFTLLNGKRRASSSAMSDCQGPGFQRRLLPPSK